MDSEVVFGDCTDRYARPDELIRFSVDKIDSNRALRILAHIGLRGMSGIETVSTASIAVPVIHAG